MSGIIAGLAGALRPVSAGAGATSGGATTAVSTAVRASAGLAARAGRTRAGRTRAGRPRHRPWPGAGQITQDLAGARVGTAQDELVLGDRLDKRAHLATCAVPFCPFGQRYEAVRRVELALKVVRVQREMLLRHLKEAITGRLGVGGLIVGGPNVSGPNVGRLNVGRLNVGRLNVGRLDVGRLDAVTSGHMLSAIAAPRRCARRLNDRRGDELGGSDELGGGDRFWCGSGSRRWDGSRRPGGRRGRDRPAIDPVAVLDGVAVRSLAGVRHDVDSGDGNTQFRVRGLDLRHR